jgi:hypothetical protein
LDGNEYAVNKICWFINKDDRIGSDKPLKIKFFRITNEKAPKKVWKDKIAVTQALSPAAQLQPDVNFLCEIESDLEKHPMDPGKGGVAKKYKHWFDRFHRFYGDRKYLRVDYEVHVFIRSLDLRFEVWIDGERVSEKTNAIVNWHPEGEFEEVEDFLNMAVRKKK